jgi:glycine dehydrogenase subunit 1
VPYILNSDKDISEMLKVTGVRTLEDLFAHLPKGIRLENGLDLPKGLSEMEAKHQVEGLAAKNKTLAKYISFLGAGYYDHYVPSAVNFLISHSNFLTAYTPYQPECSQGILQAIYEYQSYVCLLTGMDVSNASMFDGASAAAEAVLMAMRVSRKNKVVVAGCLHPEYKKVLTTYLSGINCRIVEVAANAQGLIEPRELANAFDADCGACLLQSPNFFGLVEDVSKISSLAKANNILTVLVTNPMSLGVLKAPGELGVDIVCGEGQPLGLSLNMGGPGFGFLAAKNDYLRQMPGRIVGRTKDRAGRLAYCLTLSAREQHIRREKATSNICSNQSLCAITSAVYLSVIGKDGFTAAGQISCANAQYMHKRLKEMRGIKLPFSNLFFNEFTWEVDNPIGVLNQLKEKGIIGGYYLGDNFSQYRSAILSCCTEKNSKEEIDTFINTLALILHG